MGKEKYGSWVFTVPGGSKNTQYRLDKRELSVLLYRDQKRQPAREKSLDVLAELIDNAARYEFDRRGLTTKEIGSAVWPEVKDPHLVKESVHTEIHRLRKLFGDRDEDRLEDCPPRVFETLKGGGYRFIPDVRFEPEKDADTGPVHVPSFENPQWLDAYRRVLHHYHLTLNTERKPVWLYSTVDFSGVQPGPTLCVDAPLVLSDREQYTFVWEAQLFGLHLLMTLKREEIRDVGVELFPFANVARAALQLAGVRINDAWVTTTVTDSIVIISEKQLAGFENLPVGPIPEDRSPELYREWRRLNSGLVRMPSHEFPAGGDTEMRQDPASQRDVPFTYLGNNREALDYLIGRIPEATRIEDTTVRWKVPRKSVYEDDIHRYRDALAQSKAKFRSITSPVQDKAYVAALRGAYGRNSDRQYRSPDQIKCFRLNHRIPLLNFVLIFDKERHEQPYPSEVLFGFGAETVNEDTAVFRSTDPLLTQQFHQLFTLLREEEFSQQIDIDHYDFPESYEHQCDVLATFPEFPVDDIRHRIELCRSHIRVCITGSPLLEHKFVNPLRDALKRGCQVEIALWKPESEFVKLRGRTISGDENYVTNMINGNMRAIEILEKHGLITHWCEGQASVSVCWIDDLIYFSTYWIGMNASDGPHFLVRADSETGQRLRDQYNAMLPPPKQTMQ